MVSVSLKIVSLFFLASFFSACNNADVPDDLISEEVMVDLVCETHLLESRVGRLNLNSYDSATVAFDYLQRKLWDTYGIDSTQYNDSYEYYAKYPKLFTAIYDKVEEKLQKMENEAKGIEMAEPIIKE